MITEENIEATEEHRTLIPQNFILPIAVGILSLIAFYCLLFFDESRTSFFQILPPIGTLYLLIVFKKYLDNYTAERAIFWLNYYIIASVISIAFLAYMYLMRLAIPTHTNHVQHAHHPFDWHNGGVIIFLILLLFPLITFFIGVMTSIIYIMVKFGNALRAIQNDFIGWMYYLGVLYSYVISVGIFALMPFFIIKSCRDNIIISLITHSILITPVFVITTIFYKAKKYQEHIQ